MPRLTKDNQITPKRTGYDNLPANATAYERRKLMKDQIKLLRRISPDTSKMYSIEVVGLKITYYCKNREKYKAKFLELIAKYPERELIGKLPKNKKYDKADSI